TAVYRPKRLAVDRVRDQHNGRVSANLGATASSPGPLRRPHPHREGHRSDEPAVARFRPESDLVGDRCARLRTDSLDANAGGGQQ
ncbi:unnamed protein product, partial [Fusarium equiseti]